MSDVDRHSRIDDTRRGFREYAAGIPRPATRSWTLGLFERGVRLAGELEAIIGPLAGRRILEIGSAHGGDLAGLYACGARCIGSDRFAFDRARLKRCLRADDGRLQFVQLDGFRPWPIADQSCDVVLCMSVLELAEDLDGFFRELARVLKPGGVGLIETGVTCKMLRCDPIYGLPLTGLLPNRLRRLVAERVFRRGTDYILSHHKFHSSAKFEPHVVRYGLRVVPMKLADSPIMARVSRWPMRLLWQYLVRRYAFDFVLIVPPALQERIHQRHAIPTCPRAGHVVPNV